MRRHSPRALAFPPLSSSHTILFSWRLRCRWYHCGLMQPPEAFYWASTHSQQLSYSTFQGDRGRDRRQFVSERGRGNGAPQTVGSRHQKRHRDLPPNTAHLSFRTISPVDVDTSAEEYLKHWLQQQGQAANVGNNTPSVEVYDVLDSTTKRAVLTFRINGIVAVAVGQSRKKKLAKMVCCMHATELLHYYQSNGPATQPVPLALSVEDAPTKNQINQTQMASEASFSAPTESVQKAQYYCRYDVPPSRNPIVNRATELLRKDGDRIHPQVLNQLNQCIPGASRQLASVPIAHKVHVVNFVIDKEADLVATGVGISPKQAKSKCAAHALHIIKLYKQSVGSNNRSLPSPALLSHSTRNGEASEANLVQSLPQHNQLIYRYLQRLFRLVPKRRFEQKSESINSPSVSCVIELGGMRCSSDGINCFEAERRALDTVITEMQLYDERVTEIITFISCHPSIVPENMPTASLPTPLRERISTLSKIEQTTFRLPNGQGQNSIFEESTLQQLTAEEQTLGSIGGFRPPNPFMAARMQQEHAARHTDPRYLDQFHPRRSTLAMATVRDRVLETISHHQVVVIAGTTGCGKTTQVPQYLLDDAIQRGVGDQCSILVTQPRRLSTFSVAHRIASERLESIGADVGYAVRLDAVPGRHLNICTSGVLLQILGKHPHLDHITHLVLDEVHERDVNCDFILALVKDLLPHNPTIRIVLMSATIEAEMFSGYFSGAPVIRVDGAVYPVSVYHLEDIQNMMLQQHPGVRSFSSFQSLITPSKSYTRQPLSPPPPPKNIDYDLIAMLVHSSIAKLKNDAGNKSILVFLPGWKELSAAKQAIEGMESYSSSLRCHIILLHSSVDTAQQRSCFQPSPAGCFKVVLATNIAESGITIDDVAVVIDTGLIKETAWVDHSNNRLKSQSVVGNTFDASYFTSTREPTPSSAMSTQLKLKYASRANCTQRTGRAGRTQGGVCYRLFSRQVEAAMANFPEAEIHRVPLSQVILKCLSLQHHPRTFLQEFIEPPHPHNVLTSMSQLQYLGAVTPEERLTPLGLYLSRLPCDPRTGKMIMMGAVLQCLDSTLTIAATTDLTPFSTNKIISKEVNKQRFILSRQSQSDPVTSLNAYNGFCANGEDSRFAHHNYLNIRQLQNISQYKQQYRDILLRSSFIHVSDLSPGAMELSLSSAESTVGGREGGKLVVDDSSLSKYALDIALVKACIASCLFPNIAVLDVEQRNKGKQKLILRTRSLPSVAPSSGSVCRRVGGPSQQHVTTASILESIRQGEKVPAMFYVYQDVFRVEESKTQFLREVSSISLWALLLFCGSSESFISYNELLGVGVIEDWIGIQIDKDTYRALCELRRVLDSCLLRKYKSPFEERNNSLLEQVRGLCRDVLHSAETSTSTGSGQHSLSDSGSIVPPSAAQSTSFKRIGDADEEFEIHDDFGEEAD